MASSPAVVAVLGDALLRKVLIRLPTAADLLRAALACKPFLRASRHGPFLRRFRALHPSPRILLGFLFLDQEDGVSPPLFLSAADAPADEIRAADFSGLLDFDVVDNGYGLIFLVAISEYRLERWVAAAGRGRAGGLRWKLLGQLSRLFYWSLERMFSAQELREHELVMIGVVDGVVFLHQCCALLKIDPKTMKLTRLSENGYPAIIYPYVKPRAWPPLFLKPTESDIALAEICDTKGRNLHT